METQGCSFPDYLYTVSVRETVNIIGIDPVR